MLQIVGEGLAPGEVLTEIGEAASERVPPRIDDLGVGEHQLDEGHVEPVVGQFIDEERPVGAALHPRPLQIFDAKLAPFLRRRVEDRLRIMAQLVRQDGNVRQLGRAFDQAV